MIFNKFKIKTKLILSFAFVILFMAVISAFGIVQIYKIEEHSSNVYRQDLIPLETLEALKADFVQLRILVNMTYANTLLTDETIIKEGIKATEEQYAKLRESGDKHLARLNEAYYEDSASNTTKEILKRIYDEFWPNVQAVNEAALAGDIQAMYEARIRTTAVADEINAELNVWFAEKMTQAGVSSEYIAETSKAAMAVLFVVGMVAMIISFICAIFISRNILRPIIRLRKATNDIAKGNFETELIVNSKDEIADLTCDLVVVQKVMKGITSNLAKMSEEIVGGDIDASIDCSELEGVFLETADGINGMARAFVDDMLVFLAGLKEVSNGDFEATVPKLPGKKAVMNNTFDAVSENLKAVSCQINNMVNAAMRGDLSRRVNANEYEGSWYEIMNSLNLLMDAVASPIRETQEVLENVAQGNFERNVGGDYQGEFLRIKDSINIMVRNIASYIEEISRILAGLANNDLDSGIQRQYVGKFSDIKDALNNIITKFNQIISDIAAAAEQVTAGARQISESSMMLASGAAEQAAAVEELSATVQVINENTTQNADNARRAETLSNKSRDNAMAGDSDMHNMLVSMESIKESSNNIAKIIKVIDEIAFQTNLLALNAAVEAARAGEYGKGFAVVAEEVRNLAGRSQNAAKETAELIEESIRRVDEGATKASLTARALQTIVSDVSKTADIVTDISDSSEEQAAGISQVTEGLYQITEVVQNNSATSEESAAASQELLSQAEMLRELVSKFKLKR